MGKSQEQHNKTEIRIDASEEKFTPKEQRDLRAKLIQEKDKKVDEVREEFEKRMRKSNPKTDEIAIGKWRDRMNTELREINEFYKEEIAKLDQYTLTSTKSRQKLAEEIIQKTNEKATARKIMIIMTMDRHMEGEHVTTEEVAEIDMALEKMTAFYEQNPEIDKLYQKINKKESLEEKDYQQVIEMIQPYDLKQANPSSPEAFRASSAGILMGAMNVEQRKELVQQFIKSEKGDAEKFVDMMIGMQLLDQQDALKLLEGSKYKDNVAKKIEDGTYKKQHQQMETARKEYQRTRQAEYNKYRGRYNKNIAEKVFSGKGIIGMGAMVWGFLTTSINILASRKKGEKMHQWLGRAAKNPYVYAGLAGMAAGAEITGSNMKAGTWFGAGPVSGTYYDLMGDKEEEQVNSYKANAQKQLAEIRATAPQSMVAYLENGGFHTVQTLRAKIDREKRFRQAKNMPLTITIDELIRMESSPIQKQRLVALKGNNEKVVNINFSKISEAAHILQIESDEAFIASFKAKSNNTKKTA